MLQKKTDNTIYNIRNCTLLYIICLVSEIIGIYCAASDELQIKRDFFGMYDEYITDMSTSALNITLPDTRLVSDEVYNTCYFECLIFSVLSNKDLCKYLRNTHFDENQCLSAAMSEFVNLCYNEHVKELSIDIIYYEVLVIINNTSPNATKFELNNQECFKDFTIAFYDKLIAENKALLSKRKNEEASCSSDARREQSELNQNQDCVLSSYIHTLMLNYDDSALNMDQILTRIIENTSSDELSNSSDYKLSCNMLRIFTNRFELSNEVSRTRQVENFHKEIKTYFAKCFKIGQDLFAFRFAIIYQPTKGMENAGHYFCLYFDYEIKEFFTINYKERVPILEEHGLDYLFEHSMMVTYERIDKKDDSYMNGCYDYLQ